MISGEDLTIFVPPPHKDRFFLRKQMDLLAISVQPAEGSNFPAQTKEFLIEIQEDAMIALLPEIPAEFRPQKCSLVLRVRQLS
jgi:hypothetical protein